MTVDLGSNIYTAFQNLSSNIEIQYVHMENQNQVTRANSFIIQGHLKLWISIEVCIFISDPGGFNRPTNSLQSGFPENKPARNIKRKRESLPDSPASETVSLQTADMAKCDSPKEVTWIAIRPSQDKKQRPDKRYFGNLSGVVFSVCQRCLWGVRFKSC